MGRIREYGFDPGVQERARRHQLDRLILKIVYYAILLVLLLLFARFGSAGLAERAQVKIIGVFKMGTLAKTRKGVGALTGIGR